MTINLHQGQQIVLAQAAPDLQHLLLGLGWDVAQRPEGIRSIFVEQHDLDLDATLIGLNEQQHLGQDQDVIYFGNLQHESGAVTHLGDHLTGGGQGDNEQIVVNLAQLPTRLHTLLLLVNIYRCQERHQDFRDIDNAFVRLVNHTTQQEVARYHLWGQQYRGMTALKMVAIQRLESSWQVLALGEGLAVPGLKEIIDAYRG